MSDENVEDVFDDVTDGEITHPEGDQSNGDHSESFEVLEKSVPRGYMSKEAWVDAGRDPEDWVSPEVFKERGERIKMKADYDNRFKNLSMYYQKQMEIQRSDLMARRDDAIDTADKAEVKRLDKELKELDEIEQLNKIAPEAPAKPKAVLDWEARNPWSLNAKDEKLPTAQRVYQAAIADGESIEDALKLVDTVIAAKFIDTKKKVSQVAESSRQSSGKADVSKPSMATLTSEEKKIWDAGIFESKDEFLKAVQDDRKLKAGKK